MLCNLYRVLTVRLRIDRYFDLLSQDFQLIDSGRTVDIARHQQRFLVSFQLEHPRQLSGECGFTGTLQSRHEDYGKIGFQFQVGSLSSHECRKLVMHDLYHHLARLQCRKDILSQSFGLDRIGKSLRHLIIDIRLKQCLTHIFQGFRYIYFGYPSLAFQYLEGSFESLA